MSAKKRQKQASPRPLLKDVFILASPTLLHDTIPFLSDRLSIWSSSVTEAGGHLIISDILSTTTSPNTITHILLPTKPTAPSTTAFLDHLLTSSPSAGLVEDKDRKNTHSPHMVTVLWLVESLKAQQHLPESQFPPPPPLSSLSSSDIITTPIITQHHTTTPTTNSNIKTNPHRPGTDPYYRFNWVGSDQWTPLCEKMSINRLVLQGIFSQSRCIALGNEGLYQVFTELAKYERAVGEIRDSGSGGGNGHASSSSSSSSFPSYRPHGPRYTTTVSTTNTSDDEDLYMHTTSYRELKYARVAAVVRGCAFKITPPVVAGQIPFVGEAIAGQINDVLRTGTTEMLEGFRHNVAVTSSGGSKGKAGKDSKKKVRSESVGGASRAMFCRLPGVAERTARNWWNRGLMTFEDVEDAVDQSKITLTVEQLFSLQHRSDFLEVTTREEVEEMKEEVERTLSSISTGCGGEGRWRVELVGGGRRCAAAHDADFLCTLSSSNNKNNSTTIEGAILKLVEMLERSGKILPRSQAMHRLQHGLLPNHISKLKQLHLKEEGAAPRHQTLDRFDHFYGIYQCNNGKYRRLDVIITPPEEYAFGLVGWIGSRMFLRFMRLYAKDEGMFLNSHCLMIKETSNNGGNIGSYLVPGERPPRREGKLEWYPGWTKKEDGGEGEVREVKDERDVFELIGLPYREPFERDC